MGTPDFSVPTLAELIGQGHEIACVYTQPPRPAGRGQKPKPSPEALIKCARALDVQICDCLMVGDSISDIRAGKAAGTVTAAVLTGLFTREELSKENPDFILDNVSVLSNIVE